MLRRPPFLSLDPDGSWRAELVGGASGRGRSAREALSALPGCPEALDPEDCIRLSRSDFEAAVKAAISAPRKRWSGLGTPKIFELAAVFEPEEARFLTAQRLLWVESAAYDDRLEIPILPGGGSLGLFRLHGREVSYLHGSPRSLEGVLRAEGSQLEQAPPEGLAWLFAEVYGRSRHNAHHLATTESLLQMERDQRGYKLDHKELDRVSSKLVEPTLERNDGIVLTFATVSGRLHDLQAMESWRVTIRDEAAVSIQRQPVTRRIFRRVPTYIY